MELLESTHIWRQCTHLRFTSFSRSLRSKSSDCVQDGGHQTQHSSSNGEIETVAVGGCDRVNRRRFASKHADFYYQEDNCKRRRNILSKFTLSRLHINVTRTHLSTCRRVQTHSIMRIGGRGQPSTSTICLTRDCTQRRGRNSESRCVLPEQV